MTAVAMREMPQSTTDTIAGIFTAPFRFFGNFFTPVYAQANGFDYGLDSSGFTVQEQEDPRIQDPFANADIVEPRLDELNDAWKDCFSTHVIEQPDNKLGLVIGEAMNPTKVPEKCRTDENNDHIEDNEDLLRYRFFLADTVQSFSIACAEHDDAACEMLVYGVDEGGSTPSGPVDTSGCPTAPVAQDQTVVVTVGDTSLTVHPCIQSIVQQLLTSAQQDPGVSLAGSSGWRDPQRQIELRMAHCGTSQYAIYEMPSSQCSPPTARPGSSNHEKGTAIDFRCNGGSFYNGSPCWNWLSANNGFGLINLPSESWHWSHNGN
jgi:hypothetical protein